MRTLLAILLTAGLAFAQTKTAYPYQQKTMTFAQMSALSLAAGDAGMQVYVTDCATTSCVAGSGSTKVMMTWDGSAWAAPATGGTAVSVAAPYITIGGTAYIPDGMYAVTTPPASGWTALNSQTSSTGSQGEIVMTTVGTTNGSFYGFYRTITSNTLEAAIQCTGGSGGSTWRGGVGVRGSGGDMYIIGPNANGGQSPAIGFLKWTNETTQSGSVYDTVFVGGKITYLKVVNNGSSVTPYASFDGKTWMQMYDGGGGANNVTGTGWVFGVSGSGNGALNNTCVLLSWKEY